MRTGRAAGFVASPRSDREEFQVNPGWPWQAANEFSTSLRGRIFWTGIRRRGRHGETAKK